MTCRLPCPGKSIEIINTDAEGRLVLADGLFYARQLGCTHLIDAATLTGAVVVALGSINAGIFANDEAMYNRFSKALDAAGEKMWRLPLDDEYKEIIRSNIADIVNSGGRWGGADHRCHVSKGVRRGHALAAPRYRRHCLDRRTEALDRQGPLWNRAPQPGGVCLRSCR